MKGSWLKRVQRIKIFLDCTFEVIQIISRGNLLSEGVIGIGRLIGFKNLLILLECIFFILFKIILNIFVIRIMHCKHTGLKTIFRQHLLKIRQ